MVVLVKDSLSGANEDGGKTDEEDIEDDEGGNGFGDEDDKRGNHDGDTDTNKDDDSEEEHEETGENNGLGDGHDDEHAARRVNTALTSELRARCS